MSKVLQELNEFFQDFDKSPAGYGADMRMDLAELIWRGLKRKGWTQRELAKRSGQADAIISNLVHGNKNCTLDTAGLVLHALEIKPKLVESPCAIDETRNLMGYTVQGVDVGTTVFKGWNYGQAPEIGFIKIETGCFANEGWKSQSRRNKPKAARGSKLALYMDRQDATDDPLRFGCSDAEIFHVRPTGQHGRNVSVYDTNWTP